jgi:hypothetical protein
MVATVPFSGSEPVPVAEAMQRAKSAIAALEVGCGIYGDEMVHPVTCCRAWGWPPEELECKPPEEEEPWKCEGRLDDATDLERAPAILRSFEVSFQVRDVGDKVFVTFLVPADWTPENEIDLWVALQEGKTRDEFYQSSPGHGVRVKLTPDTT